MADSAAGQRKKTRFVLAASKHIAGMINPPSVQAKVAATGPTRPVDAAAAGTAAAWLEARRENHEGSWWGGDFRTKWLEARSGKRTPAAAVGSAASPADPGRTRKHKVLEK